MARDATATATAGPGQALDRILDASGLAPRHWKIWWLSVMGVFLDGFDLFIIAVALPIIVMDRHHRALPRGDERPLTGRAGPGGAVGGEDLGGGPGGLDPLP
jgi:hypothetical protein